MSTSTQQSDEVRDWPLWWFARLESAIGRGDFQAAASAQRELERLGVTVKYRGKPHTPIREVTNAASR